MWQNSKQQSVTKLKNSKFEEKTQKTQYMTTLIKLKMGQDSNTQNFTKLKIWPNSKYDKTQNLKMWLFSK